MVINLKPINQSINENARPAMPMAKLNLGHKHKAPDRNDEPTHPMMDLPHIS